MSLKKSLKAAKSGVRSQVKTKKPSYIVIARILSEAEVNETSRLGSSRIGNFRVGE